MPKEAAWNTTPMSLVGPMDSRSRPADLGPGSLRFKLNLSVNSSGKLSRRSGHSALSFGSRSDNPDAQSNWDFHRRGTTREPITLLSEVVSPDRLRYLFAGTQSRVDWLNNNTSEWTNIINSPGADQSRWKAAALRTKVVFTNNVDQPRIHELGDPDSGNIPELQAQGVVKAKVVVQYQNVILLMNLTAKEYTVTSPVILGDPSVYTPGGTEVRLPNRIQWSDYRDATKWAFSAESIAGFQDLDDGEEILNCAELAGLLYIFTDRAIWILFPQVTDNSVFGLRRWYSEPKNRTACLRYENALVATGKEFFWLGGNTIYWANQFSTAPSSPDWLLKASGLMFEGLKRIDPAWCASPVGEFLPDGTGSAKEVWFSWPMFGSDDGVNDYSLVLSFNTDSQTSPYQTGDYVDHGYTAFTNFTHVIGEGLTCATTPTFIGASGEDWCLKSVGNVFYRESVTLIGGAVTTDIPDLSYARVRNGYFSQMLLMCPLGSPTREKILRWVKLISDIVPDEVANLFRLRIGGSYILADPLSTAPTCGVLWHDIEDKSVACPDVLSLEDLAEGGMRQDDGIEFPMEEQARHLYLDLKIVSPAGAAPIGSNVAFAELQFDALTLP